MKTYIQIPKDFMVLCKAFEIKPEWVLDQYIDDLCSLPGSNGSDERRMAKEYFLRGAIASNLPYEKGQDVLEDFDGLYHKHYPSIGNKNHKKDRNVSLKELEKYYESKEFAEIKKENV